MSAVAASRVFETADPAGAVVIAAEVCAGHDGAAELVVRLRHENGALGTVALDPQTGFDLMRAAGAGRLEALVGRAWLEILEGL
ncbi:MAG TPA: hypothetical protein VMU93_07060 [Caulobacteraceae bacterium]|nr:hypothetical protein [Caulobacteraceae bacterium]